jgi:hypothetical protein
MHMPEADSSRAGVQVNKRKLSALKAYLKDWRCGSTGTCLLCKHEAGNSSPNYTYTHKNESIPKKGKRRGAS